MFCNCAVCKNIRAIGESEFRTRTQVLIDDELCIDFPPEAYYHSLRFNVNLSALKFLLVTHSHMDHFYAHDFILRGYKYARLEQNKLSVFGNAEVKKVFDECTAREMKPEVLPNISFKVIKPYEDFCVGQYRVITLPANHSKSEDALVFYIENNGKGYLHLYDTGELTRETLCFLAEKGAKAALVGLDCTFVENEAARNARHMGIPNNLRVIEILSDLGVINESTKTVITHFSHNGNPLRERLKKFESEYGFIAAYDGLEVEI